MKNEVTETSTTKIWLSRDNICHVELLPDVEITLDDMKKNVAATYNVVGGKKALIFIDIRKVKYMTREARLYPSGREMEKVTAAAALLTGSPVSKVVGNFFLGLNKPPTHPIKLFTSEEKAVEWLKTFLEQEEN
ncbi:MAG: STAS/SEC14 domain-containing protein [Candidatus Aminicenantes bacterium]|nr:STAS/SEC14 domain-containing protein [Candidatus Aminicenantes bacterium]